MKKGGKIFMVIFFCSLIIIAAFYYLHPKKALEIILPKIDKIEKVQVKLLKDTALINADIKVRNKSFLKLNIDSLIYKIKLDTLTLLRKDQYINLQLAPSMVDTLLLPIALPYKRLMAEIKKLQSQDSVGINIDVRLVYATIFGRAVLKYKKTINIEVPVPPKLEILKIDYLKHENKTFYFKAHVKIINKGKLDFSLSEIHYNLTVSDQFNVKGFDPQKIEVKSNSEKIVILPMEIKFKSLIKTLWKVVTDKDQFKYHLKVKAMLQINKPSEEKTPVEIEKSGTTELKK